VQISKSIKNSQHFLVQFLAASIGNFCVALTASNSQNDQRNAGDVRFGAAAAPAAIIGTERGKKEEGEEEDGHVREGGRGGEGRGGEYFWCFEGRRPAGICPWGNAINWASYTIYSHTGEEEKVKKGN
jgi:hypothetical protein